MRQRAEGAMRRGVAVAADDRRAGQREALLGADDVDDALADVELVEVLDAEVLGVLGQRLDLDAAFLIRRCPWSGRWSARCGRRRRASSPARAPCGRPCAAPRRPAGSSPRARDGGRYRAGRCRRPAGRRRGRRRSCRSTYAELRTSAWLAKNDTSFAFANAYASYYRLAKGKLEEPMTTHSDHFNTNSAYSSAAYSKGAVFLAQLGYIVGDAVLDKILLEYYNQWRFKHPNANDFIRVAEKVSGIELQWYKEYWVYTTKNIDYALGDVNMDNGATSILLKRIGYMPMPVDVMVTYKDGSKEMYYIPMNLMYGAKPAENTIPRFVQPEWKWVNPEYTLTLNRNVADIKEIEIDPSKRLADVNRVNNKLTVP